MAPSDAERIRHAKLFGSVRRVQGQIWRADADLIDRHRRQLPELWEAIDAMLEHVEHVERGDDWTRGMRPS